MNPILGAHVNQQRLPIKEIQAQRDFLASIHPVKTEKDASSELMRQLREIWKNM